MDNVGVPMTDDERERSIGQSARDMVFIVKDEPLELTCVQHCISVLERYYAKGKLDGREEIHVWAIKRGVFSWWSDIIGDAPLPERPVMTFAEKLDRLVVEEWRDEGRPMPWVEFKQAILQAAIAAEEERQAYYAAMGESDPDASSDFAIVGSEVAAERQL